MKLKGFTRIWMTLNMILLITESCISVSPGIDYDDYSVVYRWDKRSCRYQIIKMTQYEKRLIVWDGIDFIVWCNLGFNGDNPSNVATSYRTCFRMLDYKIADCDTKFEYESGYGSTAPDMTFSCGDEIPELYCADEIMDFKIRSKRATQVNSYARLEIYVEAGVNLSITACLGIIGGVFAVTILISLFIVWKCRKGNSTEGRVISTNPNSTEPDATGQVLMGYPTTMEVMQPCERGQYRPQNVMVQQSIQMCPAAPQPTQTEQPSQDTVNPQSVTYTHPDPALS